jgi:hypothetical protein
MIAGKKAQILPEKFKILDANVVFIKRKPNIKEI